MISYNRVQLVGVNAKTLTYACNTGMFFNCTPQSFVPGDISKGVEVNCVRSCREEFGKCFDESCFLIGFGGHELFCNDRLEKLNKFWTYIEKKLKLKEKTVFHLTSLENDAIVVELSTFWLENSIRRALVTLFLRCGTLFYYNDNFQKALESYPLTCQTKAAINWFLDGNVYPGSYYVNCLDSDWYFPFVSEFRHTVFPENLMIRLTKQKITKNIGKPIDELA